MKELAPYQIFFPLGIFGALLGVGLWLFQALLPSVPVMLVHSRLMIGGFLWCFVTGFLMTAVPRMAGAAAAGFFEKMLALVLLMAEMLAAWIIDPRWFYSANALLILFLITFAGRRILKMTKAPPVFFSHIGLALILALAGCYFYGVGDSQLGFHLSFVGAILLLVLGIGTRFFSFLSGLPSVFETSGGKYNGILFHALGLAVAVMLVLAGKGWVAAYLALTLLIGIYLLVIWKIQRLSMRKSPLKYAVRIVALMIPLSFLFCWIWPALQITWFHFLFIGCFSLLTFSVATRVTLAHGSYPIDLEIKSPSLWIFLFLMTLALIFRISYGLSEGELKPYLLYAAAGFWLLAILSWCSSFFMRIIKPGYLPKPMCKE